MSAYFWYVHFTQSDGKKTYRNRNAACFATIFYDLKSYMKIDGIKSIRYMARVHENVTKEMALFYFEFLNKMLNRKYFTWKYKEFKGKRYIRFVLDCSQFKKRSVSLLYLTAARVVHEFPEIAAAFYEYRGKNVFELFQGLQLVHFQTLRGIYKSTYGNQGGHGLMYDYNWSRVDFVPITLKTFRQRLKKEEFDSVQKYFFTNPSNNYY